MSGHFKGGSPNSSQHFEGGPLIFSLAFRGRVYFYQIFEENVDLWSASGEVILPILHKNRLYKHLKCVTKSHNMMFHVYIYQYNNAICLKSINLIVFIEYIHK